MSIRIGLLWHSSSSGNLGVAALTLANMQIAREVAASLGLAPKFTIIGMRDGEKNYVREQDVDKFVIDFRSLLSPRGYYTALKNIDCILDIGGGDSFTSIYGAKRFSLLWMTKIIALARRTPLILSPQTIGPFDAMQYRMLARIALERVRTVIARDASSYNILRTIAPRAHAVLSTDVAFALPYEDCSLKDGNRPLRIGLNVSGLLYNDAILGQNRFSLGYNYAQLTQRLLVELTTRENTEVHLFAHVASMKDLVDDDARVCDQLAKTYPTVVRVPNFTGPIEAKTFMSGLDFVIAGRMHACIGAFSAGIPVVPIAYSRKFSGLFGSLGYSWLVPETGMDTESAVGFVLDCLDKASILQGHINNGVLRVESLLDSYRAELTALFQSVAR